ncbi:Hypothetical predicted protein [Mytilus galloprovincialis]|uniref:Uncharacterized protein n=1 Tax=Mytilus galloprovincialis TaxID=29158 RepID=A0A8B6DL45_MYTGA|nr:Hypothetical predicted protein [Mytilus galloprovincialis]
MATPTRKFNTEVSFIEQIIILRAYTKTRCNCSLMLEEVKRKLDKLPQAPIIIRVHRKPNTEEKNGGPTDARGNERPEAVAKFPRVQLWGCNYNLRYASSAKTACFTRASKVGFYRKEASIVSSE